MTNQSIHILPPQVANQIAAGEVVERPASVVKELVENALDAGATSMTVRIAHAGKKRIEVEDNGYGMSPSDASLALKRHATSKIENVEDLHRIASHGFRGEALPSIASVSRFRMVTALPESSEGVEVRVDGGGDSQVSPAAPRTGTRIEVLDLFLNTPARLNFMRTDKTEEAAIVDIFRVLALANPKVAMQLELDGRKRFSFPVQDERSRVLAIMGDEFSHNSVEQAIEHEGMYISSHLGLPTFHYRNSNRMIFLVNGRVIRDKQLIAALRAGYRDVMFHDRYPQAVIRIEMDPADVDVNVHPAKREVRFKNPQAVRAGVIACVRAGIECMGKVVASTTTDKAMDSMVFSSSEPDVSRMFHTDQISKPAASGRSSFSPALRSNIPDDIQRVLFGAAAVHESETGYHIQTRPDLGRALAQIHRCYILAQTGDGIILVDQHAAHERINYEKLKVQLANHDVVTQMLLTPVPLNLENDTLAWLYDHHESLQSFGVKLKATDDSFSAYSVPAMLGGEATGELIAELIEACMLIGVEAEADRSGLGRILERWLGNRACKASIKAGRVLSHEEQEALLREMEKTPNIAQCNHGRPTYVKLSLNDLDRLFGRRE